MRRADSAITPHPWTTHLWDAAVAQIAQRNGPANSPPPPTREEIAFAYAIRRVLREAAGPLPAFRIARRLNMRSRADLRVVKQTLLRMTHSGLIRRVFQKHGTQRRSVRYEVAR